MAAPGWIIFLTVATSIIFCDSHWMESRDRRMPPPVMTFLDKIRSLRTQSSRRVVRDAVDGAVIKDDEIKSFPLQKQTDNSMDSPHIPISSRPHPREKRFVSSIAMRGCHLGTCQTQNLANMLYRLGKNNFKDGSNKDTSDPLGYGRKRRSLVENPQRTDFLEKLLAT